MFLNKTILVTAVALGSALLAIGSVRKRAAAESGAPTPAPPHTSPLAGRQYRWAIKMQTRLGGEGADTTLLTGDWVTTVSGSTASGYDLACQLEQPHISSMRAADSNEAAQLAQRLGQRFWIGYRIDGAANRAHFPRTMPDDVRNLLQLVATTTQLVRPVQATPQWSSTERDGAGRYFASYQQLTVGEILKRKMRYLTLDGANGGDNLRLGIDSSEVRFTLGAQGQPERVHAHEATHVETKLGGPPLAIDIELELGQARSALVPALIGSLERAEPELVSEPIITQRPSEEELRARSDSQLIKNLTLKQVLDAIRAGRADRKARDQLEAILRRRPADIAEALTFALDTTGSEASRSTLEALGAAGTPQAQAALCSISADESAARSLRHEAMVALVLTREPNQATLSAFVQLLHGVRDPVSERQVLFTAGTVAHYGEATHPELAAQVVAALADRYLSCSGEACVVLLNGLGNVGSPLALPVLEPALRDARADRRAAAVDALRLIRDPTADRLIDERTSDPEAKVRMAAIGTVRYRPLAPLAPALSRVIQSDPADNVRIQAINLLTEQIDRSPLIQAAFVAAATSDRSPTARRLAREALGTRLRP